ncbi:unnamed protein product [Orchesella dallaii]|uniref:Uncharacterized protein n=1 Tax=Orchesella dallaii TaxID=48710 RepID=A0ABP1RE63_9HEXA
MGETTLLASQTYQAANASLYDISKTRTDGFEVLKTALQKPNSLDLYALLLRTVIKSNRECNES